MNVRSAQVAALFLLLLPVTTTTASQGPATALTLPEEGGQVQSAEGITVQIRRAGHKNSRRGHIPMWRVQWQRGTARGSLHHVGERWHAEVKFEDRVIRIRDGRKGRIRVEVVPHTRRWPLGEEGALSTCQRLAKRRKLTASSASIERDNGAWLCRFPQPGGDSRGLAIGRWTGRLLTTWTERDR